MSPKDGFVPARYAVRRPTRIRGDATKGFSGLKSDGSGKRFANWRLASLRLRLPQFLHALTRKLFI